METSINIAEILKTKRPIRLKLYSSTFGYIKFNGVYKDKIYFYSEDSNAHSVKPDGKMCDGGECIIFPSREMRDWSKFTWKKGDVLTNSSGFKVFFDKWVDEDYTKFLGKIKVLGDSHYYYYDTAYYTLVSKEEALEFIKNVEEINNDILNRETLEIEKSEFKDGDIVCISGMGYLAYGIVKNIDNSSKKLEYYVLNDMSALKFEDWLSFEDKHIQPITETQRMILFDALAKEGKYWDAEKKQVIDVKLEIKLQPFDKVLVRDSEDREWRISLFGYKDNSYYYCINGYSWKQCIPYKGNEHLLGTKNNPK